MCKPKLEKTGRNQLVKGKSKRRRPPAPPIWLTMDELRALLTATRVASTRDWLMLLVGYWHGLRVSELLALRRGDIQDGYLTCRRLKGSLKTRQALVSHADPLLGEACAIGSYLRRLRQWDKLFPISARQADRLIKRYGKIAGIPAHKLHMHVLKHSCGKHWIDKIGLEHTRQRLGHRSIRNTQIYASVTDEEADQALKRALAL